MIQINCNVSGNRGEDIPYVQSDSGEYYPGEMESSSRVIFYLPDTTPPAGWGATVYWGNKSSRFVVPVTPGAYEGGLLEPLPITTLDYNGAFPPAPSREELLNAQCTFQGVVVNSSQYGRLPWFGAALAWLTENDRRDNVYPILRSMRDKLCIVELPDGKPCYDEPNQPYSPDRFGPLDMTSGFTRIDESFIDLLAEIITEGFYPWIFVDEVIDESFKSMRLLSPALRNTKYGDLSPYCILMPGWDGVFYGWPDDQNTIPQWANESRALNPNLCLGLEHQPGRIPIGNGPDDWSVNGPLDNYDMLVSEYDPDNIHQDSTWQVVARCSRNYNRPYDQPTGDDPNPPFYLGPCSRGNRSYRAFEHTMYHWVHSYGSQFWYDQTLANQKYLRDMNCKNVS